jgi:predicted metal-dependent hydrolase
MSSVALESAQTREPERVIEVRRPDFDAMIAGLDRSFTADDDVISAHLLAVLSGLFPDGEEMFIEAVRHYRDRVTDPALKRQVNAFIGQEVTHGRQHRKLNERFAELGYRSKIVEASMAADEFSLTPGMQRFVWLVSRVGPLKGLTENLEERRAAGPDPVFRLALTAALEHYTAAMAELLLTDADLQALFADAGLFRFWAWHAIEESEHRSVAFDVYELVGDEDTRVRAMKLAGLGLLFIAGWHTVAGVLHDRRSWQRLGLARSIWRNRTNPLLSKRFRKRIGEYYRDGFHPLDHDTAALESRWRAWLDDDGPRPPAVATTQR